MKKSLKNLELKKQTISNLDLHKVKGGNGISLFNCSGVTSNGYCGNSVPVAEGGIGCHAQ